MRILLLVCAAAVNLAAAAYAQALLARFTAGTARVWISRAVLAIVGLGLGYVSASYVRDPLVALLLFGVGFGIVHVPAAAILYLRRKRGSPKS